MSRTFRIATVGLFAFALSTTPLAAREAKGTISLDSKKGPVVVKVAHAWLMKGPDMVSGKTIRRIVLSATDVGAALKACGTMTCSHGDIGSGMTIDLDAGPRIHYWAVGNDQLVQYSGTAPPESITLKTNTPERVAGTWELDARSSGGPLIKVLFDASLVKELKK